MKIVKIDKDISTIVKLIEEGKYVDCLYIEDICDNYRIRKTYQCNELSVDDLIDHIHNKNTIFICIEHDY